jgi:hypothetical protein
MVEVTVVCWWPGKEGKLYDETHVFLLVTPDFTPFRPNPFEALDVPGSVACCCCACLLIGDRDENIESTLVFLRSAAVLVVI